MAVLIEGVTLVIPVAELEEHCPGGTKELLRMVGTCRFCCDEGLAAVSFGAYDRYLAGHVLRWLRRAGLVGSRFGYWKDMAVIYEKTASPKMSCDWVYLGRTENRFAKIYQGASACGEIRRLGLSG